MTEYNLTAAEINIRDPFVLSYEGKYYMYGSRVGEQKGFDVYISENLETWSEPQSVFEYFDGFWGETDFWAPEVHEYQGKFYMFASFKPEHGCRGTAILVSAHPWERFVEHSEGAITPKDWECLDGTFYLSEPGKPYMIFCHEWQQIGDGAVCAVELSENLRSAVGKPFVLWHAGDAPWVANIGWGRHEKNYVTDGPYLLKTGGELLALWSSFDKNGYVEAIARSDDGTITGTWSVDEKVFLDGDCGHGMVFKTVEGRWKFVCHSPNRHLEERPCFREIALEELTIQRNKPSCRENG